MKYSSISEGSDVATGEIKPPKEEIRVVSYGPYEIIIKVNEDGVFLSIQEIRINKDFRSLEQMINNSGACDIDDLYQEEEDVQ